MNKPIQRATPLSSSDWDDLEKNGFSVSALEHMLRSKGLIAESFADFACLSAYDLFQKVRDIRRRQDPVKIESCSITNAKSGHCSEDCSYCAQSSRATSQKDVYPLKDADTILKEAEAAQKNGAARFSIVTSGGRVSGSELKKIAAVFSLMRKHLDILPCGSLGMLSAEDLMYLKECGMVRYHHNIETSPGFFSKVTTTHQFSDRIKTVLAAQKAELEICSGVLFGLGENETDRLVCAAVLKLLNVCAVPVNVLVAVKNTPLENVPLLPAKDVLRAVALLKIFMPDKNIKICGGRDTVLKDYQVSVFKAGADGMMIGGYLTTRGRSVDDDRRLMCHVEGLLNKEAF